MAAAIIANAVASAPAAGAATRHLYVSGANSDNIGGYAIAASGTVSPITGTPASPFSTLPGTGPRGIAIGPDDRHVYVPNLTSGTLGTYVVSASNGGLSASSAPATGTTPIGAAVTPNGDFLYVANQTSANVSGYSLSSPGSPTPTPGSPYPAGGTLPSGIAITPDGTHAYTTNQGGNVSGFNIGVDGSLAPIAGSPYSDGGFPFGITITPDGSHLYTGSATTNKVTGYSIGLTGALTQVPGSPYTVGALPQSVNASPHANFLYVTDRSANNVQPFSIGGDGSLTAVGAPVGAGSGARAGAFTPDGSRFYVGNSNDNTISAYTVGVDGTLSPVGPAVPTGLTGTATLGLGVTPDQGPLAAFTDVPGAGGHPTTFNGSISTDPDGTVFRYDWSFGDGATLADGGATPSHTYVNPGDYTAALTVTDAEGCSNKILYTGQNLACNGSSLATTSHTVHVVDVTPPTLKLSGKKTQKLHKSVSVKATCNEVCSATATGQLVVKTPKRHSKAKTQKFKLQKATAQITPGVKKTLKLKISKKGRKAASAALAAKGKVTAKLKVKAVDAAGNAVTKKRAVKIKAAKH
jgi:DNA-binding beta-propeller fold protein YncE